MSKLKWVIIKKYSVIKSRKWKKLEINSINYLVSKSYK